MTNETQGQAALWRNGSAGVRPALDADVLLAQLRPADEDVRVKALG